MALSEFTGLRKATLRLADASFDVFTPDKISADGFTAALETNEGTYSSFEGDETYAIGTNVNPLTLAVYIKSIDDLRKIWPSGFDETTESWQPITGGCNLDDVTFVFEKVCDTKANFIARHCAIGLGFEMPLNRDDTFMAEVTIYPTKSEGSEYGLAGDLATAMIPWQVFNGAYDPLTDLVAFDSVPVIP